MSDTKATVTEMNRAVKEGLKTARAVVDTTELDEFLNTLEATWQKVSADFLLVGIGIASLQYKDKTQIIQMLERYLKAFNRRKQNTLQPYRWTDFAGDVS